MKDHTEAILVEFDPKVITYEDILLEVCSLDTSSTIPFPYDSCLVVIAPI
mgnify:CR=1 FL=1